MIRVPSYPVAFARTRSAEEILFERKHAELRDVNDSLPASLTEGVEIERVIQSRDNYVKVTESQAKDRKFHTLSVVREKQENGIYRPVTESIVANSTFKSLSYTRYTTGIKARKTLEENFLISPDGSIGSRQSVYETDWSAGETRALSDTPSWAKKNGYESSLISYFANSAEEKPLKTVDLDSPVLGEKYPPAEDLKKATQALAALVAKQDGTYHDRDREKNGEVDLVSLRRRAGILKSQPKTAQIPRSGLGRLLGKKTVENPYQWITSEGQLSFDSDGNLQKMDITRRISKDENAPEVPVLLPEVNESRFSFTTYGEFKVYEARNNTGSVQRLFVKPDGSQGYVQFGANGTNLAHDLPGFEAQTHLVPGERTGVKSEYLEQHSQITELRPEDRAGGWIALCLGGQVDTQYALERLQECSLTTAQARRVRVLSKKTTDLPSAERVAAARGGLTALSHHLRSDLSVQSVGDGAREIALASFQEPESTRQDFLDTGLSTLTALAVAEGSAELKMSLPYPTRPGEDKAREQAELLALAK